MGRFRRGICALAAGGLALAGLGGVADAAPGSRCGQQISKDTVLTTDIGPCPNNGLVIAKDGITLDLNGHTVSGRVAKAEQSGILFKGVSGSTVKNGTVTGFDAGVNIEGGSGNTVREVTARDNVNHSVVSGIDYPCDLGDGITLSESRGNRILNNTVTKNGPYSGISIVGNSDANTVAGNNVFDNDIPNVQPDGTTAPCGAPFSRPNQDIGIRIEGPGADSNVVGNASLRTAPSPAPLETFPGNTVADNQLYGITIHGYVCNPREGDPPGANNAQNIIRSNTVTGNGFAGPTEFGDGIAILSQGPVGTVCVSHTNAILSNTSDGNAQDGIFLGGRASSNNTVNSNAVNGNGRHGINVTGPTATALGSINNSLVGNSGSGNGTNAAIAGAKFDGFDGNPSCDNNGWHGNSFATVNQPCVGNP